MMHQVDERLLPFFTGLLVRERPLVEARLRAPPVADLPFFLTGRVAARLVEVRPLAFLRVAPPVDFRAVDFLPLRLLF